MAVALDGGLFETLPTLQEVKRSEAEVAWLVYDLVLCADHSKYELQKTKVVYTKFEEALHTITQPKIGNVEEFMKLLQDKIDEKLEFPPKNETIESPLRG